MTEPTDDLITITDVRRVFCVKGARAWASSHGVDFRAFVTNGLPASDLYGRGDDAMVDRVLEAKKEALTNGK